MTFRKQSRDDMFSSHEMIELVLIFPIAKEKRGSPRLEYPVLSNANEDDAFKGGF